MKKFLLIILLGIIALPNSAQTLDDLKSKSKTTKTEKENARRDKISRYSGNSTWSSDWYNLDGDDQTWGVSYSYSSHFPIAVAANYTKSYFSIGGELGFTCSSKEYGWDNITAKPVMYVMATPGFYCKYFSINCGIGLLGGNHTETKSSTVDSSTATDGVSGSNTSIDVNTSSNISSIGFNFCYKPAITGYIPICDGDYYITLNAGYLFVSKIKDLNGFTCGLGFQITL